MKLRRRVFVGAVMVGVFALGVGVALAGFPNMRTTDSGFTTTTTTTKKGGGSGALLARITSLSARTAAPSGDTTVVCGVITVSYTATGPNGKYEFLVTADVAKAWWAVYNNGGQIPNDGSTAKAPVEDFELSGQGVGTARNGKVSGTIEIVLCPGANVSLTPGAGQYVGLAYLELSGLVIQARDPETGALGPPTAVPTPWSPYCDPNAAPAIDEPAC